MALHTHGHHEDYTLFLFNVTPLSLFYVKLVIVFIDYSRFDRKKRLLPRGLVRCSLWGQYAKLSLYLISPLRRCASLFLLDFSIKS